MRIAYVTETYPPELNGVALTVERSVRHLRERGHADRPSDVHHTPVPTKAAAGSSTKKLSALASSNSPIKVTPMPTASE